MLGGGGGGGDVVGDGNGNGGNGSGRRWRGTLRKGRGGERWEGVEGRSCRGKEDGGRKRGGKEGKVGKEEMEEKKVEC